MMLKTAQHIGAELARAHLVWPAALDEGDQGPDLGIAQLVAEPRHLRALPALGHAR